MNQKIGKTLTLHVTPSTLRRAEVASIFSIHRSGVDRLFGRQEVWIKKEMPWRLLHGSPGEFTLSGLSDDVAN
jgi:hypothetical protein